VVRAWYDTIQDQSVWVIFNGYTNANGEVRILYENQQHCYSMPFTVPSPPVPAASPLVSPRGAKLATRVWSPAYSVGHDNYDNIQAVCLLVHGGGFHSGYFEGLAGRLNRDGIFVAAYDQVCMGYSDPEPDAPAGYIHVKQFSDLVDDVFAAAVWAQQQAGDAATPFFLLGESFGGLQVLAAGLDKKRLEFYGVELAGVVTLGAVLEVGPGLLPPKPVIQLLKVLAVCFPRLKMPATDFSATFDEAFGNREWALTARKDPAVQVSPRATLAGAISMITAGELVASQGNQFHIPLLAIHAVKDCRADCEAVMKFVDQAGSSAEGFWLTNTVGHQLLQDHKEVTEAVKDKVAEWIGQQIK
jgi:alpha-beta hydrolase superfamily lysophospholipase